MTVTLDYTQRPDVAPALLARVTNTLATWLPSPDDAAPLLTWSADAWHAAAWIVYWQNALPWFVKRVQATGAPVPGDLWAELVALAEGSRERTRRMLDDVAELLAALEQAGIPALPFKGAALAPLVYPDPLVRPMGDLDILVHARDIDRGVVILRELGYRFFSRSAEDEVYLKGERKANVWAPDNVHPVEMHYTLREEYAGLAYHLETLLWDSAKRQPFWQGTKVLLPSLPALFHHVCAHATSDWLIQRGRLMHLDDVRKLAAHMDSADWATFLDGVTAHGARFVYPILAFARRYAAPAIPDGVMAALAAETPPALRAWAARTELGDTSISNPTSRSGLGLDLAGLLARSHGERVGMWLRSVFPRRRNLTKRYPQLSAGPAWPLCYALLNLDRAKHMTLKALGRGIDDGP